MNKRMNATSDLHYVKAFIEYFGPTWGLQDVRFQSVRLVLYFNISILWASLNSVIRTNVKEDGKVTHTQKKTRWQRQQTESNDLTAYFSCFVEMVLQWLELFDVISHPIPGIVFLRMFKCLYVHALNVYILLVFLHLADCFWLIGSVDV